MICGRGSVEPYNKFMQHCFIGRHVIMAYNMAQTSESMFDAKRKGCDILKLVFR